MIDLANRLPASVKAPLRPLIRRWRYLPTARKIALWRVGYLPQEVLDRLRTPPREPRPPRWLQHLVGCNFEGVGNEFLDHFVTLGGLEPGADVLDIGCGAGRMAIPLTRFLAADGSYIGFDVVPEAIEWCRARITARHPRFRFDVLDVRNARYNPGGGLDAATLRFPYPDASVDFAIATSVFTHLGREAAANYLREARRTLRPDGCLFSTFFALDDFALEQVGRGASTLDFRTVGPGYRTLAQRPGDVDFAVAYEEAELHRLLGEAGLRLEQEIHRGSWCGRSPATSYQDIVIAVRA